MPRELWHVDSGFGLGTRCTWEVLDKNSTGQTEVVKKKVSIIIKIVVILL